MWDSDVTGKNCLLLPISRYQRGGGDRQCKLNRTSCIIGGFCISHVMGWGAFPSCKKGVGLTFSVGFPIHRERLKFCSSSRGGGLGEQRCGRGAQQNHYQDDGGSSSSVAKSTTQGEEVHLCQSCVIRGWGRFSLWLLISQGAS